MSVCVCGIEYWTHTYYSSLPYSHDVYLKTYTHITSARFFQAKKPFTDYD